MNRMIKVSALCGAVALGAGMFIGCSEQGDGAANPVLQGLANPALQGFIEEALRDGIAQYGAADGCVIVMDAKTGTVLQHGDVEERYELGSVIKPLTVAVEWCEYGAAGVPREARIEMLAKG